MTLLFDGCIKFIEVVVFSKATILGLCHQFVYRHSTVSISIMCSDSYPIPILSLFLYHPYIPYFLIQRIFHFLVSFLFLLHACLYSHQVSNSNVGLAPKIGLLLGQSYMVIPMNKHFPTVMIESAVVYLKSTLFTNSYVQKYFPLFIVRIFYMCIT